MSWVELIADRKIRDAQDEGKFDNLEGKGKPLNLDVDRGVPAELRLAHRLMREAGILPDWIEIDKDLRTRQQRWEAQVEEYARGRELDLGRLGGGFTERNVDAIRDRFLRRAAEQLRDLNRATDRFNLVVPVLTKQRLRISLQERMDELSLRFPRLAPTAAPEPWLDLLEPPSPQIALGNRLPLRGKRDGLG